MDIFIKILENNLDDDLVFDTFFTLNARKIRKFENKFANQLNSC